MSSLFYFSDLELVDSLLQSKAIIPEPGTLFFTSNPFYSSIELPDFGSVGLLCLNNVKKRQFNNYNRSAFNGPSEIVHEKGIYPGLVVENEKLYDAINLSESFDAMGNLIDTITYCLPYHQDLFIECLPLSKLSNTTLVRVMLEKNKSNNKSIGVKHAIDSIQKNFLLLNDVYELKNYIFLEASVDKLALARKQDEGRILDLEKANDQLLKNVSVFEDELVDRKKQYVKLKAQFDNQLTENARLKLINDELEEKNENIQTAVEEIFNNLL